MPEPLDVRTPGYLPDRGEGSGEVSCEEQGHVGRRAVASRPRRPGRHVVGWRRSPAAGTGPVLRPCLPRDTLRVHRPAMASNTGDARGVPG